MATLVTRVRKDGSKAYRVKWPLGGRRGAPWQSETFEDRRAAVKFQTHVEANGHRWPDGWVKGFGYVTGDTDGESFGSASVTRRPSRMLAATYGHCDDSRQQPQGDLCFEALRNRARHRPVEVP